MKRMEKVVTVRLTNSMRGPTIGSGNDAGKEYY